MTILDIAAEVGVSITTVSRVINRPELVKPDTRKKVEAALKRHNYTPNAIAQGLVRKTMHTVAILSADIRRSHFSSSAYMLESLFFERDYTTILCNTGNDLHKKIKYIRILAEKKVDGLVLLGSIFCHPEIEQAITQYMPDTPIILTNGQMSLPNTHSILCDHERGIEMIVNHMVKQGCKKILFVYQDLSSNAQRKLSGFRKGMEVNHLPIEPDTYWPTGREDETGISVIEPILKTVTTFDAIVCADDLLAMGIIRSLQDHHIHVPQDVLVSGYGNSRASQLYIPSITSLDSKDVVIAEIAANMLHGFMQQQKPLERFPIYVKPDLVVREST